MKPLKLTNSDMSNAVCRWMQGEVFFGKNGKAYTQKNCSLGTVIQLGESVIRLTYYGWVDNITNEELV